MLGSFGTSGDDCSSYVTAHDGGNLEQDSDSTKTDDANAGHDGQTEEGTSLNKGFLNTLSIRKRREHYKPSSSAKTETFLTPNKGSQFYPERSRLPTRWRSGSGSWDIQTSFPRRISSKLWYQSHTVVSATIPERIGSMAEGTEAKTCDYTKISTSDAPPASEGRAEKRAMLQKSKTDHSSEVQGKQVSSPK